LRGIKTNPPPEKKKELGPTCAIYSGGAIEVVKITHDLE